MANFSSRIPAKESTAFTTWQAPEVKDGQVIHAEKLKERGPRGELVNVGKNDVIYNKMTVAQLDEITLQAYKDVQKKAYQEGFQKGQQDGYLAGEKAAEKDIKKQTDSLKNSIEALTHFLAGQDNEVEQALVNVATCIASSILRRELSIDSTHIEHVVAEAVAMLPMDVQNISVFLNQDDLALLKDNAYIPEEWKLQLDPSMNAGGCRVVTRQSVVDYTLEEQFQQTVTTLVENRYAELAADKKQLANSNDRADTLSPKNG
ncbi:MAG: flagellar assembly protein FliH [Gammaproteobacteria bacterium]|jgi:flagellar assembly protein FliH